MNEMNDKFFIIKYEVEKVNVTKEGVPIPQYDKGRIIAQMGSIEEVYKETEALQKLAYMTTRMWRTPKYDVSVKAMYTMRLEPKPIEE